MKKSFLIVMSLVLVAHAGDVFGRRSATEREIKQIRPTRPIERVNPNIQKQVLKKPTTDSTTLNVIQTGNFDAADKQFRITTCTMSDGNVFIGWEAFADKAGYSYQWRAGRGGKYNTQLRQLGTDMIYTYTRNSYFLENNCSVPFDNGNVLVAYNDKIDHSNEKGRFVVLGPEMKVVTGPVTFCESRAGCVSATSMLDGDAALIAYSDDKAQNYKGKFIIVNKEGEIIKEADAYTYKGDVTEIATGTTWNGKAFVAYNSEEDNSLSIEVNVLGNISRGSRAIFNYQKLDGLAVCPLSNKNTLVFCNRGGSAQSLLIGPDGKYIGSFQAFHPQQVSDKQVTLLSNDNVFISFIAPGEKAMCAVVDSTGKLIKGPVAVCELYNVQPGLDTIAQTKLHNDMVVVITHGYRKEPHNDTVTQWTVLK